MLRPISVPLRDWATAGASEGGAAAADREVRGPRPASPAGSSRARDDAPPPCGARDQRTQGGFCALRHATCSPTENIYRTWEPDWQDNVARLASAASEHPGSARRTVIVGSSVSPAALGRRVAWCDPRHFQRGQQELSLFLWRAVRAAKREGDFDDRQEGFIATRFGEGRAGEEGRFAGRSDQSRQEGRHRAERRGTETRRRGIEDTGGGTWMTRS